MITAHPSLPEFEYIKPDTVLEASQFLNRHAGEARVLSGGTDIFVRMRDGIWKDKYLVDIKGLEGSNDISFDPVKGLAIGAAVNMNRVCAHPLVRENYPLLVKAVESVASYQLRTRATIVGNICNASPAGDTIGACMLLGGVLNVHGLESYRQVDVRAAFLGPGQTVLKPGDVVTSIQFPVQPEGTTGAYLKLGRNKISDLAIIGVTVLGYPDEGTPSGYRLKLALASVAPVPLVVDQVEVILARQAIDDVVIFEAAQAAQDACSPIDDVRSGARYRSLMVRNLSKQALLEVWQKIRR